MAKKTLVPGARFYKCALQVNSFDYLQRHSKPTSFSVEASYNEAIVQACLKHGIEVIAVTDHYRIKSAANLIEKARSAGIIVFPGFEAVSKDGVHFLCLLDPASPIELVQSKIAACGIHDDSELSPTGDLDACELLDKCQEWEVRCVAAHVVSDGGLLRHLKGQPRIAAWTHSNLLACSLPGPANDAPEDLRPIILNRDGNHRRERPVAIVNSQDVCDPADFENPGTSCWIKMSEVSAEGLRQAFLDPDSRIRLASDPVPEKHTEFANISWETNGFLRDCSIDFNENLNVLVGGRGTGKSTVIESIRYVLGLEPSGEDAKKNHDGIIRHVVRSGTKITLRVRSYRPDRQTYTIERTVPNLPKVKDEEGNVLDVAPSAIVPNAEVYGQHEISELAKSPEKLTSLLGRFVDQDPAWLRQFVKTKSDLAKSCRDILVACTKLEGIEEQLSALPTLETNLNRYRKSGVEKKLAQQDKLVREDGLLDVAREVLEPFQIPADELDEFVPLDLDFLSDEEIKDLPSTEALKILRSDLRTFESSVRVAQKALTAALNTANEKIDVVQGVVDARKAASQADYEKVLRELQKDHIDGAEFVELRKEIERLKVLRSRKTTLSQKLKSLSQARRNLLSTWDDLKLKAYQKLERAAKKVSKALPDRLRVHVVFAGNREPLEELLRSKVGGQLKGTLDTLRQAQDFSVAAFADACRKGADELVRAYGLTNTQAARIAEGGDELCMEIEELNLPHITQIELNVGPENQPPEWRELDALSTGQKATALLLLLLLDSDAPLIIDQPENDLDNRFIVRGVIPRIRQEKRRRQFIFSTHNANIPVLGDAELILGLAAVGEAGDGHIEISPEHVGSIDSPTVADMIKDILEGGREAFTLRRLKYGF